MEKRLYGNCTRMLRAVLNKSWKQHPTKQQLYSQLPPISKTSLIKWTRHEGHCWRTKDKLISDVLLSTPSCRWARVGQPARLYLQQLCDDTGCSMENLPGAMNDRDKWQERVREICASSIPFFFFFFFFLNHTHTQHQWKVIYTYSFLVKIRVKK